MTGRRGIFFNSKARSIDTNIVLDEKISSESTSNLSQNDVNHSISLPTSSSTTTTASTGIGKKKLIFKNTKRTLNKTIYSGPRKIFSTSYKANRAQLNHKAFFGGNIDETIEQNCSTQITTTTVTKRSVIVKSKSTDNIRTTMTITENGKTKIICPRDQKQMYTIVPNIRQPTTCEELGETQSYIDDMEYLLAGIQSDKMLSSRCLSAIKFGELCSKPSFRMHLRTECAFERVLDLLKDAPDIPSLNICTGFILYVLSSDTLTSGITSNILHLMIELIEKCSIKISSINNDEYEKIKQKIFNLINQTNQDDIFYEQKFNTCDIILETLVNITQNHFKTWLRNEIRLVNGFDFMIDSINTIVQDLSNNDFECYSIGEILIRYRKVCRYINMLDEFSTNNNNQIESISTNNDLNRMYIAQYNQYLLFHSLSKLFDLSLIWFKQYSNIDENQCSNEKIKISHTCEIFRDGCKTILLLLTVLTNDCELHCDRLTTDNRFFSNLLQLLVIIEQSSLPNEDKFDVLALALNLLINLVQNTKHVYKYLMEENMPNESKQKIYEYLAHIFCAHESLAAKAESQEENDWMMEDDDDNGLDERLGIQNSKNINNENNGNFNRALQKATGHMENTFVAAFAGIILGVVLLRDHITYANQIKHLLPDKCFDTLAFILKKFFFFLRMSHAFTPSGIKTLEEITTLIFSLRD